jgi:hypothetical protein
MTALKGLTPALARLLLTTPAALYERQRALVTAGILDTRGGRGPGSGVRGDAYSVALLVIAALATTVPSDVEARTRAIMGLKLPKSASCHLTGHKEFIHALAGIFASRGLAARVTDITVSRTDNTAVICYKPAGEQVIRESRFGHGQHSDYLRVSATLLHGAIMQISRDVSAIMLSPDLEAE